ncbi:MAG TPA: hypothetical protein PKJ94_04870 [Ferruginibacter sp.]|nr:hypothetical protein [Ferruginibacter sp.]
MKKPFLLLVLLALYSFCFSQVNLVTLIKPGTQLVYLVQSGEQQYYFMVKVKTVAPAVTFDWEMTEPASMKGSITHTATAMASATTMHNMFTPGDVTLDDNTISVWLSKATYTNLRKSAAMLSINQGEAPKKMGLTGESKVVKILLDAQKETIEEEIAKEFNADGNPIKTDEFISFYNSVKMPVILRMKNATFAITLKEIRMPK